MGTDSATSVPTSTPTAQPPPQDPSTQSASALPRTQTSKTTAKAARPPSSSPVAEASSQPSRPPNPPHPKTTSTATVSVTSSDRNLPLNLVERPAEKQVAKKSVSDVRPSKTAAAKADKAAEKAAEVAALATERAALEELLQDAETSLTEKLAAIEKDIENQEEEYIRATWAHGNVLRGWDGFGRRVDRVEKTATGNASGVATGAPKHRKSRPADRIFSLSSSTSNFRLENPDVAIQKRTVGIKKKKKR